MHDRLEKGWRIPPAQRRNRQVECRRGGQRGELRLRLVRDRHEQRQQTGRAARAGRDGLGPDTRQVDPVLFTFPGIERLGRRRQLGKESKGAAAHAQLARRAAEDFDGIVVQRRVDQPIGQQLIARVQQAERRRRFAAVIVADRVTQELADVQGKVYTRDQSTLP